MYETLEGLVYEFRAAIDQANAQGEFAFDQSFLRFPCGCCGDASELLAQYLLEHGIRSTYVCGNRYFDDPEEGTQSHAWLRVDGLIIDITGDQFCDRISYYNYDQRVYIGPGDAFHDLFYVNKRDIHEFNGIDNYSSTCQYRLSKLYGIIRKYCKTR